MQTADITTLNLRAIDEIWMIRYLVTQGSSLRCLASPGGQRILSLYGNVEDRQRVYMWLRNWLKQKALQHLVPWLQQLSITHNLPYNRVILRSQRTIWGSCNHNKNISLNYKLLFVPRDYAQHVLLHELCHTKHLNHSKRFWALLNKLDPNTQALDRLLLKAESYVPKELFTSVTTSA